MSDAERLSRAGSSSAAAMIDACRIPDELAWPHDEAGPALGTSSPQRPRPSQLSTTAVE
jgi:hypothetical protein